MCLLYGIIIMLSVYQEVNDPYLGYDKNLETVKRSVARCTIPKGIWTVALPSAISCRSTRIRDLSIGAQDLTTRTKHRRSRTQDLSTRTQDFSTRTYDLSTKKKGPSTRTVDLSFRDWDGSSRTPGQWSDRKSGASELKILVPKLEMLTPGLNIFSSGTENHGNTHDLRGAP